MEVGTEGTVADGSDRVCKEVSAGPEIAVEEATAAAPRPVSTELDLLPLPRVRLLSLGVDVLEGPCPPKTVLTGTTVVVPISKYVVGVTPSGPVTGKEVTNPEVTVVVTSMGKKVLINTHSVVVGQFDPPDSFGPGVNVAPDEVGVGVTDG